MRTWWRTESHLAALWVCMKERLGVAVAQSQDVKVADLCDEGLAEYSTRVDPGNVRTLRRQQVGVSDQRALERDLHEVVAGPRLVQDGEVDPEAAQIYDGGEDNEPEHSCAKVLGESGLQRTHEIVLAEREGGARTV